MTNGETNKASIPAFWLYACGFFLLWEWLRPLKELTDTANLSVFIVFLVLSLTLAYLKINIFIRNGIKLLYILYVLNFLYFEGAFFKFKWIPLMIKELAGNMNAVFQGDWTAFSDVFRSILFYVLLGLMTYLLRYWLVNRKKIFVFFFMTLVYITVLDTFTPYEAKYAIIRTVVIGFAVMGILTFYRILDRENLENQAGFAKKWLTPLVVMVGISVIIGYAAPKASPIWPDPVPYITSYSEDSGVDGSNGMKKVGYGADDSSLGGPFIGDDTMVYETETDTRQYWKVETKDVYTGKGWVTSEENGDRIAFTQDDPVPITNYLDPEMKVDERTSIIKPLANYPHIIYPLGLKKVQSEFGHSYEVDISLEKIYVMDQSEMPGIGEYTVEYDSPRFSVKSMMSTVDSSHSLLTPEFMEQYTQLPENLPQRVKDLAVEIANDEETWYDKAKAIEDYFDQPQFQYDQKDVAVPGENEDYVDQFLFETMKGYCDNFSSSMVVMMRSLGIPTRWVKGYTEGDFRGMGDSGKRLYVVTNNNAHSWVEVFFPEVGWVPFEPTKGFANNAQFAFDQASTENSQDDVLEAPEAPEVDKPEEEKQVDKTAQSSFSWKDTWAKTKEFLNLHWDVILLVFLVMALIGYILYKKRLKWLPRYLVFRYRWKRQDKDFPVAYFALLKQLNRYGLKRKPEQTLREYAHYIDRYFSSEEMSTLTSKYERYLYKGSLEEGSWENTKQLWENLIKKTIA
jgi:transglutaminase-like putative cysteine protease